MHKRKASEEELVYQLDLEVKVELIQSSYQIVIHKQNEIDKNCAVQEEFQVNKSFDSLRIGAFYSIELILFVKTRTIKFVLGEQVSY